MYTTKFKRINVLFESFYGEQNGVIRIRSKSFDRFEPIIKIIDWVSNKGIGKIIITPDEGSEEESINYKYVIRAPGYTGNMLNFWKKGGAGYTNNLAEAELFTKKKAQEICKGAPDKGFTIWPFNHMLEVCTLNVDHQKVDKSKKVNSNG